MKKRQDTPDLSSAGVNGRSPLRPKGWEGCSAPRPGHWRHCDHVTHSQDSSPPQSKITVIKKTSKIVQVLQRVLALEVKASYHKLVSTSCEKTITSLLETLSLPRKHL